MFHNPKIDSDKLGFDNVSIVLILQEQFYLFEDSNICGFICSYPILSYYTSLYIPYTRNICVYIYIVLYSTLLYKLITIICWINASFFLSTSSKQGLFLSRPGEESESAMLVLLSSALASMRSREVQIALFIVVYRWIFSGFIRGLPSGYV